MHAWKSNTYYYMVCLNRTILVKQFFCVYFPTNTNFKQLGLADIWITCHDITVIKLNGSKRPENFCLFVNILFVSYSFPLDAGVHVLVKEKH